MTREELANQLEHTKNNYIMGLAAFTIFESEHSYPLLRTHALTFGEYTVEFEQLIKLLRNVNDRGIALNEFAKMLMRTLLKESFEHIKDYCEETDQYAAFKSEHWYEFGRLIRNFLSHNCIFEFNKYDRERLPVTWKDRTITVEMNKQTLGRDFFGHVQTWELFQEFQDFVENRLQ